MECGPMHAKVHTEVREYLAGLFFSFTMYVLGIELRLSGLSWQAPSRTAVVIVLMSGPLNVCVQTLWIRGTAVGLPHGSG